MGCWIGRSYEVLVALRDVKYCAAARCVEPPGASQQLEESTMGIQINLWQLLTKKSASRLLRSSGMCPTL